MTLRVKSILCANYVGFTAGPKRFLKLIGITIDGEPSLALKLFQWFGICDCLVLYAMQVLFVVIGESSEADRYAAIVFINYYTVALGKFFSILMLRSKLVQIFDGLQVSSPNFQEIRYYNLQSHLRTYQRVEKIVYNFFKYIVILYTLQPVIESFVALWTTGVFGNYMPLFVWPLVPADSSGYKIYAMYLFMVIVGSHLIGFSIVSIDVSLLSCVSQLCARFDLLSQKIAELKPEREGSIVQLKQIIMEHQRVLKLAKEVKLVFASSVAFSLCSSSFIICFVAYQLLDDSSLIEIIKAFLLLCYESKQVILICYFGNKLMDESEKIFEAIFSHAWYMGSLEYRRLIIILLLHTRRSVTLKVAGVVNVSLATLKQVFSNAYQIFTLLKTA